MGLLIDGKWHNRHDDKPIDKGRFVRTDTQFRDWITADGSSGPGGAAGFKAESGRYHLYVSHACPWAHRTLIFRTLKGLQDMVSMSVVHWFLGEFGWTFVDSERPDTVNNAEFLHQVYTAAKPDFTGRVTVPVLWDKHQRTIVSNESSEIIRMFNRAFDGLGANRDDYYPEALRDEIDAINERVYHTVNNGVYRAGFATTQEAYEEAVVLLFESLDWLEDRLSRQRYLTGSATCEADWRLATTLFRFDPVYVGHFKCNLKRIADYPNLAAYTRDLYQQPGIAETVRFDHIKAHYYGSHESINPNRIVPAGPEIDYEAPHDRDRFG